MFVAVVIRKEYVKDLERSFSSARHDGSLNAFVAEAEEDAVNAALSDRDRYDPLGHRYDVLVGVLGGKVVELPKKFKVVKL